MSIGFAVLSLVLLYVVHDGSKRRARAMVLPPGSHLPPGDDSRVLDEFDALQAAVFKLLNIERTYVDPATGERIYVFKPGTGFDFMDGYIKARFRKPPPEHELRSWEHYLHPDMGMALGNETFGY